MHALSVRGVGLFAPGYRDAAAFASDKVEASVVAPRDVLPARARRGTSLLTRMMADVVDQAIEAARFDAALVRTVYASAYGEIQTLLSLLTMIHGGDGRLSPVRFATSVHNTAGGLISIAQANRGFSTAIAAGDQTVAMGLLEAAALAHSERGPLVAVFADEPVPEMLAPDIRFAPVAVALAMSEDPAGSMGTIVDLRRAAGAVAHAPPTPFAGNPAARALPLVRALYAGKETTVVLDGGPSPWVALVEPARPPARDLPPLSALVPHKSPSLLLDEVTQWDGQRVACRVELCDSSPFVEAGRVATTIAVEYMAQCVAVYAGLRSHARGEPIRIGYLVGAREITLEADCFRVGDVLHVEARHVWGDDTLGSFACHVERAGQKVARGILNVYRGEKDRPAT